MAINIGIILCAFIGLSSNDLGLSATVFSLTFLLFDSYTFYEYLYKIPLSRSL